jgi:hypothetical protein
MVVNASLVRPGRKTQSDTLAATPVQAAPFLFSVYTTAPAILAGVVHFWMRAFGLVRQAPTR